MSESRLKNYKNKGKDISDLRRQRSEASVELRKAKKDEQMSKRRNLEDVLDGSTKEETQATMPIMPMQDIVKTLQALTNVEEVFHAVQSCRRMLSREKNPPIDSVIDANILPILTRLLLCCDKPDLQFEAAWALTNIASGTSTHTREVVKAGAIQNFVYLLESENLSVVEQAVWALGNISGDGADLRDAVIKMNALDSLLKLIQKALGGEDSKIGVPLLRNIAWAISNLCRNKNPPPPIEAMRKCLPSLVMLLHHQDREIISDACWAVSYISDGTNERIQEIINSGVIPKLASLLDIDDVTILTPSLRSLGNVVTGDDDQTQAVLDMKILQKFGKLLGHNKAAIQKETCWIISNITAGNPSQIQSVIDYGLLPYIINVISKGDFKSQKEAVWVINNLCSGGQSHQILKCVEDGGLVALCGLLHCKDVKLISILLESLTNMLNASETAGCLEEVCVVVEECGGLDMIEELQSHENEMVYNASLRIIEKYFTEDEEEDGPSANNATESGFNFSVNNNNGNGFQF